MKWLDFKNKAVCVGWLTNANIPCSEVGILSEVIPTRENINGERVYALTLETGDSEENLYCRHFLSSQVYSIEMEK